MKKLAIMLCALCVLSLFGVALGESGHRTPFDFYNYGGEYTIKAPFFTQQLSAGEMANSDDEIAGFLARAWYNLLDYETKSLGTKPTAGMAAEIYNAVKSGPGISVFTASDPDAVLLNAFFASCGSGSGWIYWFEWNQEDQVIRVMKKFGVERYAEDDEFLSDYVVNSLLAASLGGNIILDDLPDGCVATAFGTSSALYRVFDDAYTSATGAASPF